MTNNSKRIVSRAGFFAALEFHGDPNEKQRISTSLIDGLVFLPDKYPGKTLLEWYEDNLEEITAILETWGIALRDQQAEKIRLIRSTLEDINLQLDILENSAPIEDNLHAAYQRITSGRSLLARVTNSDIEPLKELAREALCSCRFQGHTMDTLRPRGSRHWYSICLVCGKTLVLTPNPAPNEIDASGTALAMRCGTLADHKRKKIRALEIRAAKSDPGLAADLIARADRLRYELEPEGDD